MRTVYPVISMRFMTAHEDTLVITAVLTGAQGRACTGNGKLVTLVLRAKSAPTCTILSSPVTTVAAVRCFSPASLKSKPSSANRECFQNQIRPKKPKCVFSIFADIVVVQ